MWRQTMIIIAMLIGVGLSVTVTCRNGFKGRCELWEADMGSVCVKPGETWGGQINQAPCNRQFRCCMNPVPCTIPNFGSGTCYDQNDVCPSGSRRTTVPGCPPQFQCCAKPAPHPPRVCQKDGYQPGFCVFPEEQCFGERFWGPCGLDLQCCSGLPLAKPTYGPPLPTKPTHGPPLPTKPTYGPPVPTPALQGLISLAPTIAASAYLGGVDSSVEFRAFAGPLPISKVQFKLNNELLGEASRCVDGTTWCFSVNFKNIKGAAVLSADPDAGPSVGYRIPLIKPNWIMTLLQGHPISAASWSGSFMHRWLNLHSSTSLPIPLVGFSYTSTTDLQTTLTLSKGGTITLSGGGFREDKLKPDCCVEGVAAFKATLGATTSLVDIGGMVREAQLTSLTAELSGEAVIPTLYQISREISFMGVGVGLSASIDIVVGTDITLKYVRNDGASLFGLPLAFDSISGTIVSLGAGARAIAHAASLEVTGEAKLTLGPKVTWSHGSGLQWNGITVKAEIDVIIDYFTKTTKISILNLSGTFGGKRGSGVVDDGIITIGNATQIQNIWNPQVLSYADPYCIGNVYPSGFTGAASIGNIDVMVWSSFDSSLGGENDLQVQYAFRSHNGNWSAPLYVGSSSTAIGMPVLEDIESQQRIILVASQVKRSSANMGALEAHLVYAFFDVATLHWSPYAPLFESHPVDVLDWLPVFSETGLWVAFIRAKIGDINVRGSGYGKLMSSRFIDGRWTEPEVVVEDSASISAFSIDADLEGNAMLAYRTQSSTKVNLCSYHTGWTCINTDYEVQSSSAPNLVYTSDAFLLVWAVNETIYSVKLSGTGVILNQHSLTVERRIASLVTTVCDLAGEGSVVVGWTTFIRNETFAYALADPSGTLYHSPTNVAPQADVAGSPGSMQLAWTGSRLLYATMFSDNSTGSRRGTFAAFDLAFDGIAHLSSPSFTPPDFTTQNVSVSVLLTNTGLRSIPANGDVFFAFVASSGMEYAIGVVSHSEPIHSSESVTVSILWNTAVNTSEGGVLRVTYFGSDATVADKPLYIEPAVYSLGDISIASGAEARSTAVGGRLAVVGPFVGAVDLQVWTRLDDGTMVQLGALRYSTKPWSRDAFLIPLTTLPAHFDDLQVRVVGKNFKATVHTTAYDERYDFSLRLEEIRIQPRGNAVFEVTLPVRNLGTSSAVVSLKAYLVKVLEGGNELLTEVQASVGGNSATNTALELHLAMRHSMVLLELNSDDQPLPELNTDNNRVMISVLNVDGIEDVPENDWTTTPGASAPSPPEDIISRPDATAFATTIAAADNEAASVNPTAHRLTLYIIIIAACLVTAVVMVLVAGLLIHYKHKQLEVPYTLSRD